MVKPQVVVPNDKGHPSAFGLGWELISGLGGGEDVLVHSGSDPGIRTVVVLLPKSRRGLIVLTNGDNGEQLFIKVIAESLDIGKELVKRA
jgi:hypothetical protein